MKTIEHGQHGGKKGSVKITGIGGGEEPKRKGYLCNLILRKTFGERSSTGHFTRALGRRLGKGDGEPVSQSTADG